MRNLFKNWFKKEPKKTYKYEESTDISQKREANERIVHLEGMRNLTANYAKDEAEVTLTVLMAKYPELAFDILKAQTLDIRTRLNEIANTWSKVEGVENE